MRKFKGLGQKVLGGVIFAAILLVGTIVGAFIFSQKENYMTLEEIDQLEEVTIVKNPVGFSQNYGIYSNGNLIARAKGNLVASAVYEEIVIYDVNDNEIGRITGLVDTLVIATGANYTLGEETHHVDVNYEFNASNAYNLNNGEVEYVANKVSLLRSGKIVENGEEVYSVKGVLPIFRTFKIKRLESETNKMSDVIALTLMQDGLDN